MVNDISANDENISQVHSSSDDPLNDCLTAFESMSLNTPKRKTTDSVIKVDSKKSALEFDDSKLHFSSGDNVFTNQRIISQKNCTNIDLKEAETPLSNNFSNNPIQSNSKDLKHTEDNYINASGDFRLSSSHSFVNTTASSNDKILERNRTDSGFKTEIYTSLPQTAICSSNNTHSKHIVTPDADNVQVRFDTNPLLDANINCISYQSNDLSATLPISKETSSVSPNLSILHSSNSVLPRNHSVPNKLPFSVNDILINKNQEPKEIVIDEITKPNKSEFTNQYVSDKNLALNQEQMKSMKIKQHVIKPEADELQHSSFDQTMHKSSKSKTSYIIHKAKDNLIDFNSPTSNSSSNNICMEHLSLNDITFTSDSPQENIGLNQNNDTNQIKQEVSIKTSTMNSNDTVNSFKSDKTLSNIDTNLTKPGAYSLNLDDPDLDPFKTNKGLMNSPTKEVQEAVIDSQPPASNSSVVETTIINETNQAIAEEVNDLAKSTTPKLKTKKKVKKPTKSKSPTVENDDDAIAPPKGAYTMDFSKFDDPNFDPFKSNKTLSNVDTNLTKPGAYSLNLDDPDLDPFKTNKGLMNSPTKEVQEAVVDSQLPVSNSSVVETTIINETNQAIAEEVNDLAKSTTPKLKTKKKVKKPTKSKNPTVENDDDAIAPPKGAYTMDFNKFDDPNFDPFKSNKTLSNVDTNLPKPGAYSLNLDDPDLDPFKTNKGLVNSPTKEVQEAVIDSQPPVSNSSVVETTIINETNQAIAEEVNDLAKSTTPKLKTKKKVKKPTKSKSPTVENDDDAIAPPKGAYTMDFNKFDDPNFDPFKSNKTLSNVDTNLPKPGAYSLNLDDPDLDPFKTNKGLMNSPTKEVQEAVIDSQPPVSNSSVVETTIINETNQAIAEEVNDLAKSTTPKLKTKKKVKKPTKSKSPTVENDDDAIAPPKGAYTMDFSKLDDPNFDPFKSNKTLSNVDTNLPKPGAYSLNLDDPDLDPFKTNKGLVNSPTKEVQEAVIDSQPPVSNSSVVETTIINETNQAIAEEVNDLAKSTTPKLKTKKKVKKPTKSKSPTVENDDDAIAPPKGAYTMDFNKFDDPNFDPFKSNKTLSNVDTNLPKPGAYSLNLDDPDLDPFKTNKGLVNSPTKEVQEAVVDSQPPVSNSSVVETTIINETNQAIAEEVNDLAKSTTPKLKTKKKVKKPTKSKSPTVENDDDAIAPPKGAYTMDFNKFDDPNFDPFKSNKTLSNVDTNLPKPGAYSLNLDDPDLDPFKTNKGLVNSPTKEVQEAVIDSQPPVSNSSVVETTIINETNQAIAEEVNDLAKSTTPKLKTKKKVKKPTKSKSPTVENDDDAIAPPKGAYTMDFSKFDDPNFDPFKSNKTLSNVDTNLPKPGAYSLNLDDSDLDPFKTNKGLVNSPTKEVQEAVVDSQPPVSNSSVVETTIINETNQAIAEEVNDLAKSTTPKLKTKKKVKKPTKSKSPTVENDDDAIAPPKGAYTMDFNKFDDPNFDPFKSNKTLSNVDTNLPKPGAYSLNLDDPDLDPFKTNKGLVNSPTKEVQEAVIDSQPPVSNSSVVETTIINETNQAIAEEVNDLAKSTTPKLKTKKKVKKPTKSKSPTVENDDDAIAPPKGAYTMDFNKFDDPNFDPFKSNKTLSNVDTNLPKPGAYSLNLDDPDLDPFKTNKGLINSPTKEVQEAVIDSQPPVSNSSVVETTIINETNQAIAEEVNDLAKSTTPKLKTKKKVKKPTKSKSPTVENDDDAIAPPKGAYTMDFNKFDDPNFDPFKSNKTLSNVDTNLTKPGAYSLNLDDPDLDPFKTNKGLINSPTKEVQEAVIDSQPPVSNSSVVETTIINETNQAIAEEVNDLAKSTTPKLKTKKKVKKPTKSKSPTVENDDDAIAPPKGAYTMDFNKFDDPNFDPFKSNKTLSNVDTNLTKPGAYSLNLDDPDLDPFKTNKGLINSPTKEVQEAVIDSQPPVSNSSVVETTIINETNQAIAEEVNDLAKSTTPKLKTKKKVKKPTKSKSPTVENDDDAIAPPKGAYTMDFNKFDDPNFDPFKSNKTLFNIDADTTKPGTCSSFDLEKGVDLINAEITSVESHLKSNQTAILDDTFLSDKNAFKSAKIDNPDSQAHSNDLPDDPNTTFVVDDNKQFGLNELNAERQKLLKVSFFSL